MMRALLFAATTLVISACQERLSFDEMNDTDRLAIGSDLLERACAAAGDPHEVSAHAKEEIRRGREYLSYVAVHASARDLENYITMPALEACFEAEGMRLIVTPIALRAGSDAQVEAIVQNAATPRVFCEQNLGRHFTAPEVERLTAACDRLGLR